MIEEAKKGSLPAHPFIVESNGGYELQCSRCNDCDAVYIGERKVCSKCYARGNFKTEFLAKTGKLYTYSIVHRSFPGIEVPYVSAIVDIDGGGTIKGNIINIEPAPENLPFDLPLRVVFKDAMGRKDSEGNSYVSYFFEPVE